MKKTGRVGMYGMFKEHATRLKRSPADYTKRNIKTSTRRAVRHLQWHQYPKEAADPEEAKAFSIFKLQISINGALVQHALP